VAFVLDASVTASWFLPEPPHPHVTIAGRRIRAETAVSPALWWYEVRNIVVVAERRKRLSPSEADTAWRRLVLLSVQLETPDPQISLVIARRHGLSFYDAAYVELALRLGLELATRDTAMAAAAQSEGVPLIGPTQ
jgi:predicted nucleic acid-binding protein